MGTGVRRFEIDSNNLAGGEISVADAVKTPPTSASERFTITMNIR